MPDRYTTQEAADILGVNSSRVRQLILERQMKVDRIGKAIVLTLEQIEQLRNRHDKPGPKPKG